MRAPKGPLLSSINFFYSFFLPLFFMQSLHLPELPVSFRLLLAGAGQLGGCPFFCAHLQLKYHFLLHSSRFPAKKNPQGSDYVGSSRLMQRA